MIGSYEGARRRAYPHTLVELAHYYDVPVSAVIPAAEAGAVTVVDVLGVLWREKDLHNDCTRLLRRIERAARAEKAALDRLLQEGCGNG